MMNFIVLKQNNLRIYLTNIIINYYIMKQIILNRANYRPSWELSFFTKVFFNELYEKFKFDDQFWNKELLNKYVQDYNLFIVYLKNYYNIKNDIADDVPTIIVNNWRENKKLINYIIERNGNKDKSELYKNINGSTDDLEILDIDEDDYNCNSYVEYGCHGRESFRASVNYDTIIDDLKKIIYEKYTKNEINEYLSKNNIYKYTKKCFEIENLEELCGDEY